MIFEFNNEALEARIKKTEEEIEAIKDADTGILATAKAYTDDCIGDIGTILDSINGEVV